LNDEKVVMDPTIDVEFVQEYAKELWEDYGLGKRVQEEHHHWRELFVQEIHLTIGKILSLLCVLKLDLLRRERTGYFILSSSKT
jgi:hypothetical protein